MPFTKNRIKNQKNILTAFFLKSIPITKTIVTPDQKKAKPKN
jgi:hypothetical protein